MPQPMLRLRPRAQPYGQAPDFDVIFPDMKLVSILIVAMATNAAAAQNCIKAPYSFATTDAERQLAAIHASIAPALGRFPSLATALKTTSPDLCLSDQLDNAHAFYDLDRNRIVIDSRLSKGMQAAVLLHEIRHVSQFTLGACPTDDLAMKQYARAVFALEADASAISMLISWDMKEFGDDTVWAALSTWPSQADIAKSFADQMANSGDAPLAVTAAFYQWYDSETRREKYYIAACSAYLDRQDASHALPVYRVIPDTFLDTLCRLPDGST